MFGRLVKFSCAGAVALGLAACGAPAGKEAIDANVGTARSAITELKAGVAAGRAGKVSEAAAQIQGALTKFEQATNGMHTGMTEMAGMGESMKACMADMDIILAALHKDIDDMKAEHHHLADTDAANDAAALDGLEHCATSAMANLGHMEHATHGDMMGGEMMAGGSQHQGHLSHMQP